MVGLALILLVIAAAGRGLLPYLNHELEMAGDTVTISSPSGKHLFQWSSLRFRVHERIQIIEVFDSAGSRLYAVDFLATNAHVLLERISSREAGA
jgi:hypothetical protein